MIEPLIDPIEVPKTDFNQVYRQTIIDPKEELPPPPVALSIGTHRFRDDIFPTHFGTYGNFSCLVGASKSKKTFLKSALLAGYIGGAAQTYFSQFKGHRSDRHIVLDIDTEQSKFDVQRVSKRVLEMVGADYHNYKAFFLREWDAKTRLDFVEYLILELYKGDVGLVAIDGAADLVSDVNNLEESNNCVQKLMKLSSEANCHIITVIHRNFGTDKPTGHLGSAILKKAETVAFVESEGNAVKVSAKHTRSMPFDDFTFRINDKGLPEEIGGVDSNIF